MDRVMPIELDRVVIRKRIHGYDISEVDELVRVCARTIEALEKQNTALQDECLRYKAELNRSISQEGVLKDTLMLAQRAADETRTAAQKHAEAIIEEARQSALAERVAAQRSLSEMRWELERLKQERSLIVKEFVGMLDRFKSRFETEGSLGFAVIQGDVLESSEA